MVHHGSGSNDASAALVLPSFTQSRTYTYESEDGNYASNEDSSMASESMASASTNNTGNNGGGVTTPGGNSAYSAKSSRFKSAMSTRARQRRMRRMRERDEEGGGNNNTSSRTGGGSSTLPTSPITPATPYSAATGSVATTPENSPFGGGVGGSGGFQHHLPPTMPDSPRVQHAKEHVRQMQIHAEQLKQYQSSLATNRTSPSNNNNVPSTAYSQPPPVTTPNTPVGRGASSPVMITPLQSRMYEKQRSKSARNNRHSRNGSRDSLPTPASADRYEGTGHYNHQHQQQHHHQRSPSDPNFIGTTNSSSMNNPITTTPRGYNDNPVDYGIPITNKVPSPSSSPLKNTPRSNYSSPVDKAATPQRSNSTSKVDIYKSRGGRASPVMNNMPLPQPHPSTAKPRRLSKKELRQEIHRPNSEEFLPDWNTESSGGTGHLNPDEVRDAANYTSIQFQCSNLSGEVEMFSGDDCTATAIDEHSVLSDGVLSGGGDYNGRGYGNNSSSNAAAAAAGGGTTSPNGGDNNQRWQNEVWSDATTPSILNRNEIFHQKAAASIVSLLSPDRLFEAGLMAPEGNNTHEDESSKDVNGDSPTGVIPNSSGSKEGRFNGMFTFDSDGDPGSSRGGEWRGMTQINRTLFRKDLDEDVKQSMIFQAFRQNMVGPSPQLSELLSQIHRRGGEGIDRAFATRRKNACGALKILSAKEENRMKICWTIGVLPAIASVLSDVNEAISDTISQAANTEARNRIISTLLNLSVNKKNRMLIVNTPGVLESMTQTIQYDEGEGRQGCCTVLLYLAKTAEARTMIVKSAGMVEVLSKIIEVPKEEEIISGSKNNKTLGAGRKSRLMASVPVSPLSPGETTLDDTLDNGSYHSRDSDEEEEEEDDITQDSSHGSSHSSHSSKTSHGDGASGNDEDDDNRSEDSHIIAPEEVAQMEISFQTAETAEAENAEEGIDIYDKDPNRFLHGARLSIFACLLCLVKSKENAFTLAREEIIVNALIGVSKRHASPSHSRAMAILAHLTRHPKNCHQLVYKYQALLPMLQAVTASPDREARRYAFCALQNLSMDKSCRAPIAHSPKIIWSLTKRCKDKPASDEDEARMAAVATLQNLSDEPANLIQFTIVKDCIGTIIQIAREDVVRNEKTDLTSFMAKNTLVTLSHWFRKIATSGSERMVTGPGEPKMAGFPPHGGGDASSPGGGGGTTRGQARLYSASLEPTVYNQWI